MHCAFNSAASCLRFIASAAVSARAASSAAFLWAFSTFQEQVVLALPVALHVALLFSILLHRPF